MKGSGTLVASVLAASTVALSSSSFSSAARNRDLPLSSSSNQIYRIQPKTMSNKDKFAPRFDGLRFIETLVTAHR